MSFNVIPVLKNESVLLTPLSEDAYNALFDIVSDPALWVNHPITNGFEKAGFDIFFKQAITTGSLLIIDRKTNKIIGCTRFYEYNIRESTLVIGHTFISRAYWGTGYNSEVKKLMLDYAFTFVACVKFYVVENNIRSIKALEKIGAEKGKNILRKYNSKEITCCEYYVNREKYFNG